MSEPKLQTRNRFRVLTTRLTLKHWLVVYKEVLNRAENNAIECGEWLEAAADNGWSAAELRRQIRAARPGLPIPEGSYRVIYADPPWEYGDERTDLKSYGPAERHYPTMSTEEERALWGAAVSLLDSNRSFIPKDASLAFVGVMKPPAEGEIIPEERQHEKEAPTNTNHHLTMGRESGDSNVPVGSFMLLPLPSLSRWGAPQSWRTGVASDRALTVSPPSNNTERPGPCSPGQGQAKARGGALSAASPRPAPTKA